MPREVVVRHRDPSLGRMRPTSCGPGPPRTSPRASLSRRQSRLYHLLLWCISGPGSDENARPRIRVRSALFAHPPVARETTPLPFVCPVYSPVATLRLPRLPDTQFHPRLLLVCPVTAVAFQLSSYWFPARDGSAPDAFATSG